MSYSSNPFAALAKSKKGKVNGDNKLKPMQASAPSKPGMNAEQLRIWNEEKAKKIATKLKKAAEKEKEDEKRNRCAGYPGNECKNPKDGKWPYCDSCYNTKLQCSLCMGFVYLSGTNLGQYKPCENKHAQAKPGIPIELK